MKTFSRDLSQECGFCRTKLAGKGRKQDEGVGRSPEHGSHHDKQKSVEGKLAVNHRVGFEKINAGLSRRSGQ
jgi:hypothetical protein